METDKKLAALMQIAVSLHRLQSHLQRKTKAEKLPNPIPMTEKSAGMVTEMPLMQDRSRYQKKKLKNYFQTITAKTTLFQKKRRSSSTMLLIMRQSRLKKKSERIMKTSHRTLMFMGQVLRMLQHAAI